MHFGTTFELSALLLKSFPSPSIDTLYRLVQGFSWVFATQERKKDRKGRGTILMEHHVACTHTQCTRARTHTHAHIFSLSPSSLLPPPPLPLPPLFVSHTHSLCLSVFLSPSLRLSRSHRLSFSLSLSLTLFLSLCRSLTHAFSLSLTLSLLHTHIRIQSLSFFVSLSFN